MWIRRICYYVPVKHVICGIGGCVAVLALLFGFSLRDQTLSVTVVHTPTTTMASSSTKSTLERIVAVATSTASRVQEAVMERGWKKGVATIFWVGEGETDENGYISNAQSAWDTRWMESFGGLDDPENRCGYLPCAFTPKENPFYVALPYSDLEDDGRRKTNASVVPWNDPTSRTSILKNRWIEVRHLGATCYGQWQDVGPFEEDDHAYVFGDAPSPKNQFGEKAGIDLSPALAACLKIDGSDEVSWRHVEFADVPQGPWRDIITTRP